MFGVESNPLPEEGHMKSDGEIMKILAAFDLTGSQRTAAELVGCSHHTVAAHVAARDAGRAVGAPARAVGWAMNQAPDDVPWQRVVGADGYLRIARRSPHLRDLQQQLLEGEGVVLDQKGCVERRFFLDEPPPPEPALDL